MYLIWNWILGGTTKTGVVITSSRTTDNSTRYTQGSNRIKKENSLESTKSVKSIANTSATNVSKIKINHDDTLSEQVIIQEFQAVLETLNMHKQNYNFPYMKIHFYIQVAQAFPYDPRVNLQLLST